MIRSCACKISYVVDLQQNYAYDRYSLIYALIKPLICQVADKTAFLSVVSIYGIIMKRSRRIGENKLHLLSVAGNSLYQTLASDGSVDNDVSVLVDEIIVKWRQRRDGYDKAAAEERT